MAEMVWVMRVTSSSAFGQEKQKIPGPEMASRQASNQTICEESARETVAGMASSAPDHYA
jgi:hypothetical protein